MTIAARKVACADCGRRYIVFRTHWKMYNCRCGKTGVDWEEYGTRWMGKLLDDELFEPPRFDDEDEYHSALLGWLNDSDEIYRLSKPEDVLLIYKVRWRR